MTEAGEPGIIEKSEQPTRTRSQTLHKIIATALYFPFIAIIVLVIIAFISYSPLIMKILWWIFIISFFLSVGILLAKLSGFSVMVLKIKNPIGNPYSVERLSAIAALWAILTGLGIGLLSLLSPSGIVNSVSEFLDNFQKHCPWPGWPKN